MRNNSYQLRESLPLLLYPERIELVNSVYLNKVTYDHRREMDMKSPVFLRVVSANLRELAFQVYMCSSVNQ